MLAERCGKIRDAIQELHPLVLPDLRVLIEAQITYWNGVTIAYYKEGLRHGDIS